MGLKFNDIEFPVVLCTKTCRMKTLVHINSNTFNILIIKLFNNIAKINEETHSHWPFLVRDLELVSEFITLKLFNLCYSIN